MKRALLLCFLGVLCLLGVTTAAAASELQSVVMEDRRWTDGAATEEAVLLQADLQELEQYLYQELLAGKETIQIKSFELELDENQKTPELSAVMGRLMSNCPDLFHVKGWGYRYYPKGGLITEVVPDYAMTGAELTEAQEYYRGKLDEIMAQMEEGWSDLEKILFINDYLAAHYQYDLRVYEDSRKANYDAYSFFRDETGVCQAYYYACRALLDACGIPSTYGESDQANHIWNVVQLNGKWYHLDVTWNDPTTDLLGRARHDYFLLSTANLLSRDGERSDWICGEAISCTDSTYNSFYWQKVNAPFVQLNGKWYYSDTKAICVTEDVREEGAEVIRHGWWHIPGNENSYWTSSYSGLGTYRGWLIYNTEGNVMGYDPETGKAHTFYTRPNKKKDIFGIVVLGNRVIIELDTNPRATSDNEEAECSLSYLEELQSKKYSGVTVSEEEGTVTIRGTSDGGKTFCVMAAGYTSDGKLCDVKMIWNWELEAATTKWQMEGKTVKLFIVSQTYAPVC